jgi:hypothetical protein
VEYGRIIKRAWNVVWQHKVLWIFGIAAALFGGGGARPRGMPGAQYSFNNGDLERWREGMPWGPGAPFGREWGGMPQIEQWIPVVLAIIGVLFVLGLIMFVVSLIVRYTSIGALIGMVNDVEQADGTNFRAGLRQGWKRFLRLFAMDLIIGVVGGIVAVGVVIVMLALAGLLVGLPVALLVKVIQAPNWLAILWGVGLGLVLLLLFIVAMVAVGALSSLVRELSFRASVIDQRGVFEALRDGMALVRGRFRESVLMWLLLVAINLAVGLVSLPLTLLGIGTIVAPALLAFRATESPAAMLVAVPFVLLFGLVALFVGGVYYAFRSSVWTLTYRELKSVPMLEQA